MVLFEIVGGIFAWIVNDAQDELFANTSVEMLSVAISCDRMPVQPWNMEL